MRRAPEGPDHLLTLAPETEHAVLRASREVDQLRPLLPAAPLATPEHVLALGTSKDELPFVQSDPARPARSHTATVLLGK
jgi:hypothetical protein